MAVIKAFDPGAGAVVLEEEIRESVINTVGAALGMIYIRIDSQFNMPLVMRSYVGV